ncbi:MAG: thiamine phosphate synthase [Bacteroidetes bacterium]|nr:thiamine phosphate synthase [Bacteroidota bacterium]
MKLVVITQSQKSDNEIASIIQMFEAGLDTLHVRKNRFSTKELDEYLKEIPSHFHNRIIIHSHHRLALKYNLKGFHFTEAHLKKKLHLWWNTKMIYLRKPNLIKSISYKRVSDLYLPEKVDTNYCFLGTMFHNVSGELYSGFYPETITAAIQKSGKKIYARGGVNEKSVELAYKLGFHGIALYGHVWKSTSPFTKYIEFVRFCKEKNIPIE